jgi:phage-related holin
MLKEIITSRILTLSAVAMLLVFLAMAIDLIAGLRKAKKRGEIRSSWGLKRTIDKFVSYEGAMLIASMADVMVFFCHVWEIVGLKMLQGVPVLSCVLAVFLLLVEFISVREKADEKTKTEISRAGDMLKNVTREEVLKAIADVLKNKE